VFIGPNRSGAGAKNFGYLELEPDPQPWFHFQLLRALHPGFLSASFLKQVANWSASVVWSFHQSMPMSRRLRNLLACAVRGRNLLRNIFGGKLQKLY